MIEKRSIGEIIKSILLLVNEAKQKNEQIKNISKPKTLLTDNKIIFKTLKKTMPVNSFETFSRTSISYTTPT